MQPIGCLSTSRAVQARGVSVDDLGVRQALHVVIGIAFWALTAVLWYMLWTQHKATGASLLSSAARVGICLGAVLGVTLWWVSHNVAISRRKGPRTGRPALPPNTYNDRLGRRLAWELEGGAADAPAAGHLVVEIDGHVKTYRSAR
jgi:hypothetical protein